MPAKSPSPSQPRSSSARASQDTILLAVTGLSPAIVTETVWALAHGKPSVLPKRVVFITTQTGAEKIREQLLSPVPAFNGLTAWQALRKSLKAGDDELIAEEPRVIGGANPKTGVIQTLADIQTPADNDLAASFILEGVRGIVENSDLRLVASIAGGRKTMGALLHAAVSLIGRETDRLTHVLVSPPYETLPGFYFPGQPGGAVEGRDGKKHLPAKAALQLADVPFVPLRNRFEDLHDMPGNFSGLVHRFSREIKEDASRPSLVEIGYRRKMLWVDDQPVKMRVKALTVLHFLLWIQEKGLAPKDQSEMASSIGKWLAKADFIPLGIKPRAGDIDETVIRHELSHIRTTLRKKGIRWNVPDRSLTVPPFALRLRD